MAGKYHRTYLKADLERAFEKMQKETGEASNSYIVRAVKELLTADGYLAAPTVLKNVPVGAGKTEDRRMRRRRSA